MTNKTPSQLSGLAGRMVADGLIDAEAAQRALDEAAAAKIPLVKHLVDNELIDSQKLAEMASEEFGVPLFDISALNPDAMPTELVAPSLIIKHHALPLFHRGNRLFIAVSDPTNLAALDEIKFHTGINTDAVLVEERALSQSIIEWAEANDELGDGLGDLDDAALEDLDVEGVSEDGGAGAAGNSVYKKVILQIRDDVTTGSPLHSSIKATGIFPSMLLQMVSIGEESGALDEMLEKVADHYEAAVDGAVDGLSSLMEPIIMSVLGVLVGGLMIAMYLPIFMLGAVV